MANIYDMIDTWNNGATTFTAIKMDVLDSASAANSLLLDLKVDGVTKASINKDGGLTVTTVDINGGTIDDTVIGGTTAAAGTFTTGQFDTSVNVDGTVTADGLTVDGDANFDSGTLFVDASANAVGIGTSSPGAKLDVAGSNATSLDALRLRNTSTTSGGLTNLSFYSYVDFAGGITGRAAEISLLATNASTTGTGTLLFKTTNNITQVAPAERMRLDSSGNVGIGTSSPGNFKLNVNGISNFSGKMNLTSTSRLVWNGGDVGITNQGTNLLFQTFSGGTLNEKMRLDSSGNVGIGTSSPSFDVHAFRSGPLNSVFESDTGNSNVRITSGDGDNAQIFFGDQTNDTISQIVHDNSDNSLSFFTAGSNERLRIDSSGNLLVGTTTSKAKTTIVGASVVGDYYSFNTTLNQLENFEICRFILPRSGNSGINAFSGTLNFNVSLFRGVSLNHQNNVSVLAHVFLGGFPKAGASTALSADIQLISTATNQPEGTSGSITIALVAEGSDDGGVSWTTLTNNSGVLASSATGILMRIRANLTGTTPNHFNGDFKCFSSISGACNDGIVLSSTTISII